MVEGLSCFLPKEPPGGAESSQRQAGLGAAVNAKGAKKLRPDIPGMYHFFCNVKVVLNGKQGTYSHVLGAWHLMTLWLIPDTVLSDSGSSGSNLD